MRRNLVQLAKWAISITILSLLILGIDEDAALQTFMSANLPLLALALSIAMLNILIGVVRWRLALRVQGIVAPWNLLLSSTLVSGFVGFLLPSFAEDAVRGYDLYKHQPRGLGIAASICVERVCGLLGQVLVGGLALCCFYQASGIVAIVSIALPVYAGVILALAIVFHRGTAMRLEALLASHVASAGLAQLVAGLSSAVQLYRSDIRAWYQLLVSSLALQFGGFLYFYVIAQSLGIPIEFSTFVMLVPLVTILSLLPVSIGGLGVKEGLFVLLFTQMGVGAEDAFLVSAVGSGLYMFFVLLGGGVFLLRRPREVVVKKCHPA